MYVLSKLEEPMPLICDGFSGCHIGSLRGVSVAELRRDFEDLRDNLPSYFKQLGTYLVVHYCLALYRLVCHISRQGETILEREYAHLLSAEIAKFTSDQFKHLLSPTAS